MGTGLNALANLENRERLHEQALAHADRSRDIFESVLGTSHIEVAFPLTCKGEALLGLECFDEAIADLERALEIRELGAAPEGNVAWTRWLLGRALHDSGRDTRRGLDQVQRAREALAALGDVTKSEVSEIDAWLGATPSS